MQFRNCLQKFWIKKYILKANYLKKNIQWDFAEVRPETLAVFSGAKDIALKKFNNELCNAKCDLRLYTRYK